MKHLRNYLALLCAIVCWQSVLAEEAVIGGLKYSLDQSAKTAIVIANSSSEYTGDIVIPSAVTYNGSAYNVTAVGDKAFYNSTITSVVITEGVLTLGESSFDSCTRLKSVSLPKGLVSLGNSCFGNCYALEGIAFPEGITKLPVNCCVSNRALTDVGLPESLETIGEGCFGYCRSLKEITIPKNVALFGFNSFLGVSLTTMTCEATIPPDAASGNAFPSVTNLYVPSDVLIFYAKTYPWNSVKNINDVPANQVNTDVVIDGLKYSLDLSTKTAVVVSNSYSSYTGGIAVPSSVTYGGIEFEVTAIGDYVFWGCAITSITIPEGVTSLGTECFWGCGGLTRIKLPGSVRSLGKRCFMNCINLKNVRLSENVSNVGDSCFVDTYLEKLAFCEKATTEDECPRVSYFGKYSLACAPRCLVFPKNEVVLSDTCFGFGWSSPDPPVVVKNGIRFSEHAMVTDERLNSIFNLIPQDCDMEVNNLYSEFCSHFWVDTLYVPKKQYYGVTYTEGDVTLPIPTLSELGIGNDISIGQGQTLRSYISSPFDRMLDWTSSNEGVVKVGDDGTLTGVSQGKATITVEALYDIDETITFEVTVVSEKVEPKATAINMFLTDVDLIRGESTFLRTYVAPIYVDGRSVVKTSADPRVATYTGDVVKALSVGTADVMASIGEGTGISNTCHVRVNPRSVGGIWLYADSVVLRPEETRQMGYRLAMYDNDDTLCFTSSDESVAVVSNSGLILAVGCGRATITISSTINGSISKSMIVNVVPSISVSSIELPATAWLMEGETMQLTPNVQPEKADVKTVSWTSSDTGIATVDENGLCTAVSSGIAAVTATATDGSGVSATCHITVVPYEEPEVLVTRLFLEESLTIAQGETRQLAVTIRPENATNKALTWSSLRPSVVSVDENGNILGVSVGKSIITAKTTDGSNLSDDCVVTVTESTGLDGIAVDEADGSAYYTLDGMKLQMKPQKAGVYIRERDGVRQKVVVNEK